MRSCRLFLKLVIAGLCWDIFARSQARRSLKVRLVPVTRKATRSFLPPSAPAARSGFSPPHSTIASIRTPIRNGSAVRSTGTAFLAAENKTDLFQAWGAIPDPDCCMPGSPNCPAKSLEETFGFQYCPGDDALLKSVGKSDYRDPACDFKDAPFDTSTPHGSADHGKIHAI